VISEKDEVRHRGSDNLGKIYDIKRAKTFKIVSAAINKLKMSGSKISLGRISAATQDLTENQRPISESTILRNLACRALYEKEVCPIRRTRSPKRTLSFSLDAPPTEIEVRRTHYLLRSTKIELASLIISLERGLSTAEKANATLRERILSDQIGHVI
jgi:hypothetical protein